MRKEIKPRKERKGIEKEKENARMCYKLKQERNKRKKANKRKEEETNPPVVLISCC